jgi:hypothetical protein
MEIAVTPRMELVEERHSDTAKHSQFQRQNNKLFILDQQASSKYSVSTKETLHFVLELLAGTARLNMLPSTAILRGLSRSSHLQNA